MFSYHLPWYQCNPGTISLKNEVRRIFYSSMGSTSKSHTMRYGVALHEECTKNGVSEKLNRPGHSDN